MNKNNLCGLYIHIPFCAKKCPYCDFYSQEYNLNLNSQYIAALERSLAGFLPSTKNFCFDTVYFGGGTPSAIGGENLARILDIARRNLTLTQNCEITAEINPSSNSEGLMKTLFASGFNRISFGVQSMIDEELLALGRMHDSKAATNAVISAYNAGFRHISADLMLGIPFQTQKTLEYSISELCSLPIDHVSAYMLKIEPGTEFSKRNLQDFADEDLLADLYMDCISLLDKKGFAQYEISNFCKPGRESRHNLKYWLCEPYLGVGPSAHSFIDSKRFYFPKNLSQFIEAPNPASIIIDDGSGGDSLEHAMLRLRLTRGIKLSEYALNYPEADVNQLLSRAQKLSGYVCIDNDNISLTKEGFLLSNTIISKLLFG